MTPGPVTLALPDDPGELAGALGVLAALAELDHPHLVPVELTRSGERSVQVHLEALTGVRLPVLLGVRRLTPGQVVTVGVPVAQALEVAATRGVQHGSLDATSIVVEPDGRPRLVGCGLAQLAGARPTPADDVHSLARVLAGLLDPQAGAAGASVSAALAPAMSGHGATRPSAGVLAAALLGALPAEALPPPDPRTPGVRTVTPAPPPRGRHPSLRRLVDLRDALPRVPRAVPVAVPVVVVLLVVVLVVVTVVVMVAVLGGHSAARQVAAPPVVVPPSEPAGPASPAVPSSPPSGPDWPAVLAGLAAARQQAAPPTRPCWLVRTPPAAPPPPSTAPGWPRGRRPARSCRGRRRP